MPPQKRRPTKFRAAKAEPTKQTPAKRAKSANPSRAKTRALAVADAVRSEPMSAPRLPGALLNPLMAFEPLRRQVTERQIAFVNMALAWSPARILVDQQAAFWGGFMQDAQAGESRGAKSSRKPTKRQSTRH